MQTFWAVSRKRKTSSEAIALVMTVSIAVSVVLALDLPRSVERHWVIRRPLFRTARGL